MPPQIDMPMNAANRHAAVAEEYQARGLIVLAAEAHHNASEALLAAIERSHDESAKRTLRLLYNRHCKDRDELQRRIEKLKEEGKDPSLPQKPETPAYHKSRQNTEISNHLQNNPNSTTAQSYPRPMSDSQNTVDESFMVLGAQRSDPGDAFNQFWNVLQGMLDNLSQPVAFATAPLGTLDIPSEDAVSGSRTPPPSQPHGTRRRDQNLSSDTDAEEHMLSKWTRRMGITREGRRTTGNVQQSPVTQNLGTASSSFQDEDFDDEFLEEGDDLSGSFCLIPSGSEPTAAILKKENAKLKADVTAMQERLKATEHLLKLRNDQDMQLRNSIFEAQRAMSASGMLPRVPPAGAGVGDMSFLNFSKTPMPIPSLNSGREAQYTRRIKELEEELRTVRAENEKNKLMITKFRERWEKLKESAKRKKEAKTAVDVGAAGVRERIVEEPEAEEELDGTNG